MQPAAEKRTGKFGIRPAAHSSFSQHEFFAPILLGGFGQPNGAEGKEAIPLRLRSPSQLHLQCGGASPPPDSLLVLPIQPAAALRAEEGDRMPPARFAKVQGRSAAGAIAVVPVGIGSAGRAGEHAVSLRRRGSWNIPSFPPFPVVIADVRRRGRRFPHTFMHVPALLL